GELAGLDLAYLHVVQSSDEVLLRDLRDLWPSALLVLRAGRSLDALGDDIDAGLADIVPIARWALANPDVVERIRSGAPMNDADPATFYGGGAAGYTDYPALASISL
ncbi:alkene reductase, partial [Microbacterium sp. B35-04]